MENKKLMKKIQQTNEAYQKFTEAIKLIREAYPQHDEIDVYLWRIFKALELMFKKIVKDVDAEVVDEEFKDIIKGFDNGKKKK